MLEGNKKIFKSLENAKIILLLSIILICISFLFFHNKNTAGLNWTFPYFSGAANFEKIFDWEISPSDYDNAKKSANYYRYKHINTEETIEYSINNYGYVLVTLASRSLFSGMGDLEGIIVFQLVFHTLSSLFIIFFILSVPWARYGFLFLYAANPVVIYFVTYPFYYYWSFVTSLIFIIIACRPSWRIWFIFLAIPTLLLSLMIRPTTLALALFCPLICLFLAKTYTQKILFLTASLFFLIGTIYLYKITPTSAVIWHKFFLGIGGYPNNFNIKSLHDINAFNYFFSQTGIEINTNAITGNWKESKIRESYAEILRNRYLEIIHLNPWLPLKNAALNFLQLYSLGHIVDNQTLTYVNSIIGLIILSLFTYFRQYLWVASIFLSGISFAFYHPPIPAYNFAAYPLIVLGILDTLKILNYRRSISSKHVSRG